MSLIGLLCVTLSSCNASDKTISGCSAEQSDLVFAGRFEIEEIKSIVIIPSNQKSISPVPDIARSATWNHTNRSEFFTLFRKSLVSPVDRKAKLSPDFHACFHIYVLFHSGKNACFLGRIGSNGFLIQPMFDRNSYSSNNNEVYNLFATEFKMVEPAQ